MEIMFTDNSQENTCLDVLQLSLHHAKVVNIAVAFLKQSGFDLIKDQLLRVGERGCVEVIVGLDFKSTEPKTLKELLDYSKNYNIKCYCFSDYSLVDIPVFHPKLYYVEGNNNSATAIIGSSNLTKGGLQENFEINAIFSGNIAEYPLPKIKSLYYQIKIKETVFTPDFDFIDGYKDAYNRVKKNLQKAIKEPATNAAIRSLKKKENRLPRAYPTQKELVIEAIYYLPKDVNGYVHLKDIQKYVREKALNLNIPFDFNTLDNSIRGRLNENALGKGGDDLFERFGSEKGGTGLYRLTQKAINLLKRKT